MEELNTPNESEITTHSQEYKTIPLSGMYQNWFLDYASYVILERAVPEVLDGLKPVQRRILHAMKELDDGRYNKVANIIGHTMKYHPHGDASIGDALVQLGQKDLLIDCQGNWGNIYTGDNAAAPRYIEARLSKFASEVVFNPKTTQWKPSYDGRNREPLNLPVKFPLLLAQGVEGIAVGLASKMLPHNFNELIDASIAILNNEDFEILPDFITGGMADCSKYNNGLRGGKVRIRARINQLDKKTLVITEIPYSTNTTSLIDSILAANDKGKIKIRKIDDNTAANVEILIHLAPGVSPDQTIDALYAFTNCEISYSPNACVIHNGRPAFIDVKEILRISTQQTHDLLRKELEIRLAELLDDWHHTSLEKIFIENEIYQQIRKCTSFEEVISTIDQGLKPFHHLLQNDVSREDILRLTEIRIKRISIYNTFDADQKIKGLESDIEEVKNHLNHLIEFAINYFRQIKKKYGTGRERKTELRNFDIIEAASVAVANQKLYVNRKEGFTGTSLKKDEYVCDCSDIDEIIVFRENGTFVVTKVADKVFVGENILHIDVYRRSDDRTIYNMIYQNGKTGPLFVKRFAVMGITRDKEYDLTTGETGTRVIYFSANPNGEAETVKITLRPKPKLKKLHFEFDFAELAIKGRNSRGNTLTRHLARSVIKKESGVSTLSARDIWFDESVKRLNTDQRGTHLGAFKSGDKIFTMMKSGFYRVYNNDLGTHFDDDMMHIAKYNEDLIITVVYHEPESGYMYLKRFQPELSDKKISFLNDDPASKLHSWSLDYLPQLSIEYVQDGKKPRESQIIPTADFIDVKSYKAKGKRLSTYTIAEMKFIEPLPYEIEEAENEDDALNETNGDVILIGHEEATNGVSKPETPPTSFDETGQATLNLDF
ncbi:MAG: DNA gyrase/topoisomerase IV subunit A [Bacteroidales bacterium]|nr:DNA gyrase/topoisomerase IV subunit A [Bacteroidales bacterium]